MDHLFGARDFDGRNAQVVTVAATPRTWLHVFDILATFERRNAFAVEFLAMPMPLPRRPGRLYDIDATRQLWLGVDGALADHIDGDEIIGGFVTDLRAHLGGVNTAGM